MRILRFIVDDQTLTPDPNCDGFDKLVFGGGDIRLDFYFTKEWRDRIKIAAFYSPLGKEYDGQVIKDGRSCMVPAEALLRREFKVQIYGRDTRSTTPYKTNKLTIRQNGGAV